MCIHYDGGRVSEAESGRRARECVVLEKHWALRLLVNSRGKAQSYQYLFFFLRSFAIKTRISRNSPRAQGVEQPSYAENRRLSA